MILGTSFCRQADGGPICFARLLGRLYRCGLKVAVVVLPWLVANAGHAWADLSNVAGQLPKVAEAGLNEPGNLLTEQSPSIVADPEPVLSLPLPLFEDHLDRLIGQGADRYRVYWFDQSGMRRDNLDGLLALPDPQLTGELVEIAEIGTIGGRLVVRETKPTDPGLGDWAYRHGTPTTYSKYLVDRHGRNVGLFSVVEDLRVVISIDVLGDGAVDYLEIYDAVDRQMAIIVREQYRVLRFMNDALAGRNAFCSRAMLPREKATSPAGFGPAAFGFGAHDEVKIFGCDDWGDPSKPSFEVGTRLPNTGRTNLVKTFCQATLRQAGDPGLGGIYDDFAAPDEVHDDVETVAIGIIGVAAAAALKGQQVAGVLTGALGAGILIGSHTERAEHDASSATGDDVPTSSDAGSGGNTRGTTGEELSDVGDGTDLSFDWTSWCENWLKADWAWSVQSMDEMAENMECPAPNEAGAASGPWSPSAPNPLKDRNCAEPQTFTSLEEIEKQLGRTGEDYDPHADPGAPGACGDDLGGGDNVLGRRTGSQGGSIYVGVADLVSIDFFHPCWAAQGGECGSDEIEAAVPTRFERP